MNSVVEDIRTILEAETELGLTLGQNLFLYREPATPISAVTVLDAPGMPIEGTFQLNSDEKPLEKPSVQIRVRGKDAQSTMLLAHKIVPVLHKAQQKIWGDYYYTFIVAAHTPYLLRS